jgi:hypothetical protein
MRTKWMLPLSTLVFVLCITPTVVSYRPYFFAWDDSDYLGKSIAVSRAFWSGDKHELRVAMVGLGFRPPIMTLLGLPWGPLTSWDSAGKCFLTLAVLTAFFIAACLFFLLRIGLNPMCFMIASVCVFAAIGPYPAGAIAHKNATGLMADSLFAWITYAATLLIPYETTTGNSSTENGVAHGFLWAVIFSAGALTRVNFLYFLGLIVPILFAIRIHRSGKRSAFAALISLTVLSIPAVVYWLRYGLPLLKYAWSASFGVAAPFYYSTLLRFVSQTIRDSPGILLPMMAAIAGVVYLIVKRREVEWGTNLLPLSIMAGYCTIALTSGNRESRFLFSGIIALPFLVGLLIGGKTYVLSRRSAVLNAMFVFCCVVAASVPMLQRANRQSFNKSEEVVAEAIESNAKHVLLATDSSTLNLELLKVAVELSARPSIETADLGWDAVLGTPIEDDFRAIRESDLIVFQDKGGLDSPFTNSRVPEYEQYIRQHSGDSQMKVVNDISIYSVSHSSK